MAATDSLVNGVENLQVNNSESDKQQSVETIDSFMEKWGFPLEDLYKIALKFFKG